MLVSDLVLLFLAFVPWRFVCVFVGLFCSIFRFLLGWVVLFCFVLCAG